MEDNIWHVIPVDDLMDHTLGAEWKTKEYGIFLEDGTIGHGVAQLLVCKCKCNPSYQEQPNGSIIVVHNSYDGREGLEWFNEIFK